MRRESLQKSSRQFIRRGRMREAELDNHCAAEGCSYHIRSPPNLVESALQVSVAAVVVKAALRGDVEVVE